MGSILVCKTAKNSNESLPSKSQTGGSSLPAAPFIGVIVENNQDHYFQEAELADRQPLHTLLPAPQRTIHWRSYNQTLGQGSFGTVILAHDITTGKPIAVKQLSIQGFNVSSSGVRINSIKHEISVLSKLNHPNIVTFLGMEQSESHISIFLEYVGGGSILSLYQRFGKFTLPLLKKYTKQILLGLEYLHLNGIIHRDIKGANILVDTHGTCKLADFGSSKILTGLINNEQSFVGTPNWMAPEAIRQDNAACGRFADIWSLGCTVIEMATGRPPWQESMQRNHYQTMRQIGDGSIEIPYPSEDGELRDFLQKCLKHDPQQRWNVRQLLGHPFITQGQPDTSTTENESALLNYLSRLNHSHNQSFQ